MRNNRLNPKLLNKLSIRIKKPEKYIKEQISKQANKHGVRSEAYFVYWLHKENINRACYFNKLSHEIQNEAQKLISSKNHDKASISSETSNIVRTNIGNKKMQSINIVEKPIILTSGSIKNGEAIAKIYPIMYVLENSVRVFVNTVMQKSHGNDWWENKVKKEVKKKVNDRMQTERDNPWHKSRGNEKIYYTLFGDLSEIISGNAGDFNKYFTGVKGKSNWLVQKLDELSLSRNSIAHSGILSLKDMKRLNLYFLDWYDLIDKINKILSK